ncbi:kinase-like domain-containing protein [Mucidula mucida]|nr:kinase-like domain-containing protein [Mucidula mucida]
MMFTDIYWLQHQPFLEQSGYNLRPKFLKEKRPDHPDDVAYAHPYVMDATRAQDGKPVMLKCLMTKRAVTELEIGFFFSDPKRKDDPQNHCVPILDVLHSPFDKKAPIIVMPRLYPCHYPGFDSVGEAIDFFRQTFEGLEYMHRHHIAHKDITELNIMMDASALYPHGHHPVHTWSTPGFTDIAKHLTRTHCWPRYYLIDFDRSQRFNGDAIPASLTLPMVPPRIHVYPENRHNRRGFFNPFPADVYALASIYTDDLKLVTFASKPRRSAPDSDLYPQNHCPTLSFLRPLWDQMLQKDPELRPTMAEAVEQLYRLCTPLPSRSELRRSAYISSIPQRFQQFMHILNRRPPLPYKKYPRTMIRVDSKDREFLTARPPDIESEVSDKDVQQSA